MDERFTLLGCLSDGSIPQEHEQQRPQELRQEYAEQEIGPVFAHDVMAWGNVNELRKHGRETYDNGRESSPNHQVSSKQLLITKNIFIDAARSKDSVVCLGHHGKHNNLWHYAPVINSKFELVEAHWACAFMFFRRNRTHARTLSCNSRYSYTNHAWVLRIERCNGVMKMHSV